MSLARQLIKNIMAGVLPRERFLMQGPGTQHPVDGSETPPVCVALTFDDGPHPKWTPAVLDALSEAGWKGTFFVIGERAAAHPDLVRRIVDEGHAIGNHTYTHSEPKRTSVRQFAEETQQTEMLISELSETQTYLMRPPKGHLTFGKFRSLWSNGQSIVLWNVDPEDFAMTEDDTAKQWSDTYAPHQGDIILLHDRLPYAAAIVRALSQRHGDSIHSVSIADWLPSTHRVSASQNGVPAGC